MCSKPLHEKVRRNKKPVSGKATGACGAEVSSARATEVDGTGVCCNGDDEGLRALERSLTLGLDGNEYHIDQNR